MLICQGADTFGIGRRELRIANLDIQVAVSLSANYQNQDVLH